CDIFTHFKKPESLVSIRGRRAFFLSQVSNAGFYHAVILAQVAGGEKMRAGFRPPPDVIKWDLQNRVGECHSPTRFCKMIFPRNCGVRRVISILKIAKSKGDLRFCNFRY
ncbi:MAG: hypothetical protein FWF77_00155, partial [Defluviitaleaceae bacterium]|nr:hypothetical protein [Defluviitaleaceae bacterium]